MTLSEIELHHGASFMSECRVRRPIRKTAENGSNYLSFMIEDYSMSFKAYAWPEHCESTVRVHDLDKVIVSGKIREFNGMWLANITSIRKIEVDAENSLQLIPRSMCPLSPLLDRLRNIVDQISNETLRSFIGWVFSDDIFTLSFISLPASRQHHHSIAGGLLEHSLECVAMVSRFEEFPQAEIELAMVGALFHDVGKIKTLQNVGKHTIAGHILDHDALTLEVLAPHLQRLDALCPDAGLALRYLWTWKMQRNGFRHPLLTIAEAISAADRISSGLNRQDTAFQEHPDWHTFARIGDNSTFWRPRLELQNASVILSDNSCNIRNE
jgi:3'-5' exoribonuclease